MPYPSVHLQNLYKCCRSYVYVVWNWIFFSSLFNGKVGHIHIQLDHMLITKIYLLTVTTMRRIFCKLCLQGPLDICPRHLHIFFKWFILQNGKCYTVFSHLDTIFSIIWRKANNYLNIKEKYLNIYFRIALMISQRSLRTEFANMSFSSLPQSKGVFWRSARDLVVCGWIESKVADVYSGVSKHVCKELKRTRSHSLFPLPCPNTPPRPRRLILL